MSESIKKLLTRIDKAFYRNPIESERSGRSLSVFFFILFLVGLSYFFVRYVSTETSMFRNSNSSATTIKFFDLSWKVMKINSDKKIIGLVIKKFKSDSELHDFIGENNFSELVLETKVTEELFEKIHKFQINQVLMPYHVSDVELWINDELSFKTDWHNRIKKAGKIPADAIEKKDIRLKFRLFPDPEWVNGRTLFLTTGFRLSSEKNYENYLYSINFLNSTVMMGYFSVVFALSLLFFFLWCLDPKKSEVLHFSLYALSSAVLVLSTFSGFSKSNSFTFNTQFYFFRFLFQSTCIILLAFSLARFKKSIINGAMLFAFPLCVAIPIIVSDPKYVTFVNWPLEVNLLGGVYFVGAAVCLVQLLYLQMNLNEMKISVERLNSLKWYVFLFCAIGFSYMAFNFNMTERYFKKVVFLRGYPVLACFSFAIIILRDFKINQEIFKRYYLSSYHKKEFIGKDLNGHLLALDIKNSEYLFRTEKELNEYGKIVDGCLSQIWTPILKQKGLVIETDGDGLRAFFPEHDASSEEVQLAFLEITQNLTNFSESLKKKYPEKFSENYSIFVRASLSKGAIRPFWRNLNGQRQPSWSEGGGTNILVESARLLDLEKKLDPLRESSILIMRSELGDVVSIDKFELSSANLEDKHGNTYDISAFKSAA